MSVHFANIIIGGGPGGINMALELKKRGIEYVLLEAQDNVGGQWGKFPVCGELISLNKVHVPGDDHYYKMRYDWHSLSTISAEDAERDPMLLFTNWTDKHWPSARLYRKYLQYVADNMGVSDDTCYNSRVEQISRKDGKYVITVKDGPTYTADRIMCGTGQSEPVMPDIKGLGPDTCTMYADYDPDVARVKFKDKIVVVLGRGNSAFEIAHNLIDITAETRVVSRSMPTYARQTHNVHDIRAQVADVFDLMQLKSNNAVICDQITAVERVKEGPQKGRLLVQWETACPHWSPPRWVKRTSYIDEIIVATGFNWTMADIFDQQTVKPLVDNRGKFCLLNDTWESLNTPDLYFIGAPMRANDPDAASGFVHGFRCNIAALGHIIAEKSNQPIEPEFEVEILRHNPSDGLEKLSQYLVKMVSTSMPLFELFSFFGNMVTFEDTAKGSMARVWPAFPRDHNRKRFADVKEKIEVVFDYGFQNYGDGNVPSQYFALPADHFDTAKSAYVHPVFHIHRDGVEVDTMHMQESLICRWDLDDYVDEETNVDQYRNVAFNAAAATLGVAERRSILPVYDEYIDKCYPVMTEDEIANALSMLPSTAYLMQHNSSQAEIPSLSRSPEEIAAE